MTLVRRQERRDTAANWTAINPVLASGELGVETDTLKVKVGNGTTAWIALAYLVGGGGSVADATSIVKGVVQLAGDLGGTAAAPTVPALAALPGTYVGLAGAAETVTVGPGGTYASISAALAYLGKKRASFVNGGLTATVSLLTGFVQTEQLKFDGVDLGWITITSVDAEVPIASEAIPAGEGAWYAVRNAVLPRIGCFFRFVTDADVRPAPALRGFDILHGSTIHFTAQTAGIGDDIGARKVNRLLQVAHGSTCIATGGLSLKDGNDIGLRAANASLVSVPNATITNCTNNGIAVSGAIVQAANATVTGSVSNVVLTPTAIVELANANLSGAGAGVAISAEGGTCYALGANLTDGGISASQEAYVDARNTTLGVADGITVTTGARIDATGRTNGVLSQTANQFRKSGIIWDNNVAEAGVIATKVTTGLGAAATPSMTFDGRTTDGIYSKGNGLVGISTAGVERAYADANGFTATILRSQNGTGVGSIIAAGRSSDGRSEVAFQTNTFSANNARFVVTTNQLSLEVGGAEALRVVEAAATADTETSLLLRRNVGGTLTVVRVSMGAADSGGAGFKMLRVPN